MERLGKNLGRYHGETIDIEAVCRDIHELALAGGWEHDTFLEAEGMTLRAYRRHPPKARLKLYLSTGIHGDEPSGPLTIRQLLAENDWPAEADIWLVPCLNPGGFKLNTRENARGVDLNREYRNPVEIEVRSHIAWLERQPQFDLTVVLHEDWEANGFYVYELNPLNRPSLAEPVIEAMRGVCPPETAGLVDGWECQGGIIRPAVPPEERPQWAEALYLIVHKSAQSYTFETPSDFPLELRVRAHLKAVREALDWLGRLPNREQRLLRGGDPHAEKAW